MFSGRKRHKRNTIQAPMISRAHPIGQRVIGKRSPNEYVGVFVRAYCTVNGIYRNPAYVVKCDIDGKERSFQCLGVEQKLPVEIII